MNNTHPKAKFKTDPSYAQAAFAAIPAEVQQAHKDLQETSRLTSSFLLAGEWNPEKRADIQTTRDEMARLASTLDTLYTAKDTNSDCALIYNELVKAHYLKNMMLLNKFAVDMRQLEAGSSKLRNASHDIGILRSFSDKAVRLGQIKTLLEDSPKKPQAAPLSLPAPSS